MCVEFEQSANDSYLIERNGIIEKISYRKNLLAKMKKDVPEVFNSFSEEELKNSRGFREFVTTAENNGYIIYQLTRL